MTAPRYGIAEWYGRSFSDLAPDERRRFAGRALGKAEDQPACPFQAGQPTCSKRGGVCSLQLYEDDGGRIGESRGSPVTVCPRRFEEGRRITRWLAEIVGFPHDEAMVAREVPFMLSTETGKPAGKIDLVIARDAGADLVWYGLEIQAVYFSGEGMPSQFRALLDDGGARPPFPNAQRRPDWRSSSAKRLMPQLQVKVPTLRTWGSKMALAVDRPFFDAIGGPSPAPMQHTRGGDIIWLVPELQPAADGFTLTRGHWEALPLEESSEKLLAADRIDPYEFEATLRARLRPLE